MFCEETFVRYKKCLFKRCCIDCSPVDACSLIEHWRLFYRTVRLTTWTADTSAKADHATFSQLPLATISTVQKFLTRVMTRISTNMEWFVTSDTSSSAVRQTIDHNRSRTSWVISKIRVTNCNGKISCKTFCFRTIIQTSFNI